MEDALTNGVKDKDDRDAILLMAKAIPEDPEAALLVRHTISWSATYDHVVDGDKWSADQVHWMVDILLRGLPTHQFYMRNLNVYLTIIVNAIHSWRYAESRPEYRVKVGDGLSELGCAMLLCSGGPTRLEEWGNAWRDQVQLIIKGSDTKGDK